MKKNLSNNTDILRIFNSVTLKNEMDINIKQILLERYEKCTLLFNANSNECFTDGKVINIGVIDVFEGLNDFEIFALIKGLVGHEASHVKWSNFKDLKSFHNDILKSKYNVEISLSLANILEDGRIERLLCYELRGFKKYIHFLNLVAIYREGLLTSKDLISNILNTILFLSKLGLYPINFEDVFSKKQQLFITEKIEPLVRQGISSKSHKEVLCITREIIEILSEEFEDLYSTSINDDIQEFIDKNIDPGYNTSEGGSYEMGDLKDVLSNQWKSVSNAHLDVFKMDLNVSEDTLNNNKQFTEDDIKDILSDLKESMLNEFENLINSSTLNNSSDENKENLDNYFDEIDLSSINNQYDSRDKMEPNFKYEYITDNYKPYPEELLFDIRMLEKQFKKLLKNDNLFLKNQKKGKIDTSKLWKVSSIYDNYVFEKKYNIEDSKYAIYILIDLSGSMDSKIKYNEAIKTALKIEGSLINFNNVEVKTVGFDYTQQSRLRVFKDFKEKQSRTANALFENYTGETNRDGFAIRVALQDLKRHQASNKLLIVISDGRPSWDGESHKESMLDVKEAVHEGRKISTIMSILINEGTIFENIKDCFYYMYENKGTIMVDVKNNPEQLMNNLVLYLKNLFKKR